MVDLAKHCARNLSKPELADTEERHTTHELEKFVATVTNEQLDKIGVPIRFKELLGKLSSVSFS